MASERNSAERKKIWAKAWREAGHDFSAFFLVVKERGKERLEEFTIE